MTPMENEKGRLRRRRSDGRAIPPVTVVLRPQTPDEGRQFKVALNLLLIEMVRQQLQRQKA
jgi:hypothetical protein